MVLSQPTMRDEAVELWPRVTSSMESAITSRDTSDAFMPWSHGDAVADGDGVELHGRAAGGADPLLDLHGEGSRRFQLHGMVSIQVLADADDRLPRSSRLKPMARSIARAGARSGPCSITELGRRPLASGMRGSIRCGDRHNSVFDWNAIQAVSFAPRVYGFALVLLVGLLLIRSGAFMLQGRRVRR